MTFHGSYRPKTFLFKDFSRTFQGLVFHSIWHTCNQLLNSNDFLYKQETSFNMVQETRSQTLEDVLIVSILLAFPVWNLSSHLSQLVLEFCPLLFFEVNWLGSRRSTSLWILLLRKVHLLFL